ncbi:MAG: multidrug ABC transporter substrate-binding protein, partial [Gemmatimonadetes bacterium]
NNARYVSAVVPELSNNLQVQKGDQNINVNVVGTTPNYVTVHNYTIMAGRMYTAGDDAARRRVAVIGSAVPTLLNSNRDAMIGQQILIRGIAFDIIGALSEKGSQGSFFNPDEQILIPLQTARYRVIGTDRLRSITVQAVDVQSMNLAMIEIERVLRRQHKIRPGQDNDFQIRNQTDILATLQQTTDTFKYLLAGIAAVSLLVGGIGIMNIMLVSVTERTREIGVRKALGATRFNILFQFLVEALVLCLLGGMIGVVLGSGGAIVLSRIAHWNTLISPLAILLAFVFSAAVGLFFGIWPARRAAALDPIVALRYE